MIDDEFPCLFQTTTCSHIRRAAEMLGELIRKFLPVIHKNLDAPRSMGVNIAADERRKKCSECRTWLLHIKALPVDRAYVDVQNKIVDL